MSAGMGGSRGISFFRSASFSGFVAGLGLVHAGDGDESHLEALFRLLQLPGDGPLVGAHELQRLLRREHVEVGRGHAQHEILFRGPVLGIRQLQLPVGLLQADEAVTPVDGLVHADAQVVDAVVLGRGVPEVVVLVGGVPRDAHLRQQLRERQGPGFTLGFPLGSGFAQHRVPFQRGLVHLQEVVREEGLGTDHQQGS